MATGKLNTFGVLAPQDKYQLCLLFLKTCKIKMIQLQFQSLYEWFSTRPFEMRITKAYQGPKTGNGGTYFKTYPSLFVITMVKIYLESGFPVVTKLF